jgi:hypothetical protein
MRKISPDTIEKFAQDFVLDMFLSDYDTLLSYDQVLSMMMEESDWESQIIVWQPFEHYDGHYMAQTINETKQSLVRRLLNA